METDLYLIQSTQGFGYIGIRQNRLCRVYIPVVTKREVLELTEDKALLDPESHPLAQKVADLIDCYFKGEDPDFSQIPLNLDCRTQFQKATYCQLQKVPFGKTTTYGNLAKAVNSPKGARAVGLAMSKNPVPIVVPCHRVLSSTSAMTGFTAPGGVSTKEWLLDHEVRHG